MSELVCEPCNDDGNQIEAFGFCLDCCDHLCEDCYKSHRKPRQTRNHTLLDKEQVRQQEESLPTKDAMNDTCPQHSEENVKYFCQTHDIPGCTVCITTDHKLCEDVVHIPQVSKGIADSEEYRELKAQIDETTKRFEAIIPAATANITKSEASNQKVINAIDDFMDDIIATIDRLANSARIEADQCKEIDTQKMNAVIIKSKDGLKKLHDMKAAMHNVERLGREHKLFADVKMNKKDAKEMQEELTEWENDNTVRICRFESNDELCKFLKNVDRLGGLSDSVDDASDFIDSSNTEDAEQTGSAPTETVKAEYLGDDKGIYIKSENEKKMFCSTITYIELFEQNKLVVVSDPPDSGSRVQVVDSKRNRIMSELVLPNKCSGMVKTNERFAALNIYGTGIVLYKVDTVPVPYRFLYSAGSHPLSSFDNRIYYCNGYNTIYEVDMNGHTTKAVVSEIENEWQRFRACAFYVNRGKTYMYTIVQDMYRKPKEGSGGYCAYTVTAMSTFLGHGPTNKKITEKVDLPVLPRSIVMSDDRKLLFIVTCENGNDVIYVLRTGTKDARVILSKKDGQNRVDAICYCSKKKQLFVAVPECNFFKVYQLSGVA